jgi:hypothetical protein
MGRNGHWSLRLSLLIMTLMICFSLFIGIIFYKYQNQWRWSTSIFFAINTLLGILYDVPERKGDMVDVFTLFYYIYGAFFLAGIIGALIGTVVFHASVITSMEMRKILNLPISILDGEHVMQCSDSYVSVSWKRFGNSFPLLATILWLGIGGIYGMIFDDKSFGSSLYFALSTISAASYASE